MDLLYVHGGPGLNSEPERRLLSSFLRDSGLNSAFWDEPSVLRPNGWPFDSGKAYTNWQNALDHAIAQGQPEIVVGASFGALGVMDLMNRNSNLGVRKFLMVAPTLDLNRVFRTMMEISTRDFGAIDLDKAEQLDKCLKNAHHFWDSNMKAGLALVWQNPRLIDHYFCEAKMKEAWTAPLVEPSYQIDFKSQNAVIDELAEQGNLRKYPRKIKTPLTILYGIHDPVFDRPEVESIVKERFESYEFIEFPDCAHFPHLENKSEFVKVIRSLLK